MNDCVRAARIGPAIFSPRRISVTAPPIIANRSIGRYQALRNTHPGPFWRTRARRLMLTMSLFTQRSVLTVQRVSAPGFYNALLFDTYQCVSRGLFAPEQRSTACVRERQWAFVSLMGQLRSPPEVTPRWCAHRGASRERTLILSQ